MAVDAPIKSRVEDELGRASFADTIANAVRALDASQGCVVGLYGSWGVGKTSLLNLIAEALGEDPPLATVEFNPWMFSGTEQLLGRFFEEISAQLRLRPGPFARLADQLASYGQLVAPLQLLLPPGPWIAAVATLGAASRLHRRRPSVQEQRDRLIEALQHLPSPLVVTIDDIDRLRPAEIRDVFQLVRLTGSFPQVIYLLAFDRERVERALDKEHLEGGHYLEKIVALAYDVPQVREETLTRLLLDEVGGVIADDSWGPFDEQLWPDVFVRGMRPLFGNLRDVKRYRATLPAMLATLGDEVALVDALALEALRLLVPGTHALLADSAAVLTGVWSGDDEQPKATVEALEEAAGDHAAAVHELLTLLFPATKRLFGGTSYAPDFLGKWRRERRVASPAVLAFYLSRALGPGVAPAKIVELVVSSLVDEQALAKLLADIDDDALQDVLARLETYDDDYSPEAAEPAAFVLLEILPRVRPRPQRFSDMPPQAIVDRLVLRFLRRVADPAELGEIVERLCGRLSALREQVELVRIVGHEPHIGSKLIPPTDAERLSRQVRERIRAADQSSLVGEPGLLTLMNFALQDGTEEQRAWADRCLDDPRLFAAVLRDAVQPTKMGAIARLATRTVEQLRWDELKTLAGGESLLGKHLSELRKSDALRDDDANKRAVELAESYLDGWRPTPFEPTVVTHIARFAPQGFQAPAASRPWPDLVARAIGVFAQHSAAARESDMGLDFRRAFEAALADSPLAALREELNDRYEAGNKPLSWRRDPEFVGPAIVAFTSQSDDDSVPAALLEYRCSIQELSPSMASNTVVVVDGYVRLSERWETGRPTDPRLLSVADVAHMLAVLLRFAAEELPEQCLSVLAGGRQPRTAVEVHLTGARVDPTGQSPPKTLAETIDLAPLGPTIRPDPNEWSYAARGDLPLEGDHDPGDLAVRALRKMASEWGYDDPDPGLPTFGSVLG